MDDGSRLPRRGPAKVIDWIQGLFFRVFHFFKGEQEDSVTEKEIISMVDEAHEKGVLQKDEAEMIQNIFAFEDKEVGVVMTHRSSVAAFAMDAQGCCESYDGRVKFPISGLRGRYG